MGLSWAVPEAAVTEPDDSAPAAHDTGPSRRAASVLLAWRKIESCGGCGLTDLWAADGPVVADTLAVVQRIARRHDDPTAFGRGAAFERLAELWRAALVEADR